MIEQNSASCKNAIAFSIIDCYPVTIQFGHGIWTSVDKTECFHLDWGFVFYRTFLKCLPDKNEYLYQSALLLRENKVGRGC